MMLSIGAAAMMIGVSISTLRRWEKDGAIKPSHRTLGRHRRFDAEEIDKEFFPDIVPATSPQHAVAYARVSSADQKSDLETQKEKLTNYCQKNFTSFEIIDDLGSGLNYKKPGLNRLLTAIQNRSFSHLVLNYKDRLLRFGSEIIFALCKFQGISVVIIENQPIQSFEYELSRDVIELMTVFSARFYGKRSHKNRKANAA